jgi:hypothetical protein
MAKKKSTRRRSAIVPSVVLSAVLLSGAAVVPTLAGCGGTGHRNTVACVGFNCATVAAQGFDLSVTDLPVFTVAAQGFDLSGED